MRLKEDENFYLACDSMLVRREARAFISQLDTVIFDIDGVLVDTRGSFSEAVCDAIQFYFEHVLHIKDGGQLLSPAEVQLFKRAGGFNSDRDLVEGALFFLCWKMLRFKLNSSYEIRSHRPSVKEFTRQIASYGGGLENVYKFVYARLNPPMREKLEALFDAQLVRRLFLESYSGRLCHQIYGFDPQFFTGEGKIKRERPIVKPELLKRQMASQNLSWGILSGRTPGEARMALKMLGLEDSIPREAIVTDDGQFPTKPDPTPLIELCSRLHSKAAVYLGDTIDDLRLVNNFQLHRKSAPSLGRLEFCLCLTDHLDEGMVEDFKSQSTAAIAEDVNAFLTYLDQRNREDGRD